MSTTLLQASNQWRTRPADERFVSLTALNAYVQGVRQNSRSRVLSTRDLTVVPVEGSTEAIAVQGPQGNAVVPTHWAFGLRARRPGPRVPESGR